MSPGRLAGTRPQTYLSRVGGGGGATQPPSNTLASPTAATMPHTRTLDTVTPLSYYYYVLPLHSYSISAIKQPVLPIRALYTRVFQSSVTLVGFFSRYNTLLFCTTPLPRSAYLLGVEGGDAGQHLALEELERGAAARGAEGHLWLELG